MVELNKEELIALSTLVCFSHDSEEGIKTRRNNDETAKSLCRLVEEARDVLWETLVRAEVWT